METFKADPSVPKVLSLFDCVNVIVGIIIGVGIYETASIIAASLPGPGWVIGLWIIGGVISLCGALCYAELASAYPAQGGDYVYLNRAYGGMAGYLFAWGNLVIIRPGSIAAMAFPFAHYLQTIWSPLKFTAFKDHEEIIMAVSAVLLLTICNCLRVGLGKWVQNILTVLKTLGLLFLFVIAITAPPTVISVGEETVFNLKGFYLALILVLFTYGGWNEIAYVASEVKDAGKNIVRSIVLGMIVVTILYVLVNLGFLFVLGHGGMSASSAVAYDTAAVAFPGSGSAIMSVIIIFSTLGAVNGLIFTGPRISYALGRGHRIFGYLSKLGKKSSAPYAALLFQAFLSVLIILIAGSFGRTVVYTTAVVWIFFLATGASIFILRKREPEIERPYKVTWHPYTTLVFCASAALLTYSAFSYDFTGSLVSLAVLAIGIPLFYIKRKN